jgi:hypothetical protein
VRFALACRTVALLLSLYAIGALFYSIKQRNRDDMILRAAEAHFRLDVPRRIIKG